MNAPAVLFVYKRPEHTRRTLESFLANPEARETTLYVFCDGPRTAADAQAVEATRGVVRSIAHPDLRLVERPENLGLARSVIAGVSQVCAEHGAAIVLEDDLVLAPTFLSFMNAALERYRDDERVYGVSGYAFTDVSDLGADAVFLPLIASWGWATWDRAWKTFTPAQETYARLRASAALRRRFDVGGYKFYGMLEKQLRGKVDSWAIRWYATVFLRGGLTLYPARSLVTNIGFDGTGVHCGPDTPAMAKGSATASRIERFPEVVAVEDAALRRVAKTLHQSSRHTPVRTGIRLLMRMARSVLRR
jgi:hypothetical protein